jgi:hypothetical protein
VISTRPVWPSYSNERYCPWRSDWRTRYVRLKRDGAVAYAHALAGRFDEADAVAKALINFGEATSSTRARSVGYVEASLASYLRGSEAAATAALTRASRAMILNP